MAILYVFRVNDPSGAGAFPPSLLDTEWNHNLTSYVEKNAIGGTGGINAFIFADASALNNWISTYKLTDSSLLADVAAWKSAHGISYTHEYYDLSADGGSFTPFIS